MRCCNVVYWIGLMIWVSVIAAAGIAAMSAFTVLPDAELGVHLDAFALYDQSQHGRIAAGHVMEPVFTFVDLVSIAAAVSVLVMLLLQFAVFRMKLTTPSNVIRTVSIVIATVILLWRVVVITPEMNHDLRAYWDAAKAGDVVMADQRLASFNVNHRRARPMMDATLVFLLITIGASAVAMTPARADAKRMTKSENL